jgi:NitT/TauT family transport system ATP-binding protein
MEEKRCTAENLPGEISDLWERGTFPAKSILVVTHNNEEAVLLAARIVVPGANPGCIRGEVKVNIPRPRDKKGQRFVARVDYIYTVMANPQAPCDILLEPFRANPIRARARGGQKRQDEVAGSD